MAPLSEQVRLAEVAAVVGEPARAAMLLALGDGSALPAGELAACAEVSAATASEHLLKMLDAGLVRVERQGRHRYYRLASAEVAELLESLMVVAHRSPEPRRQVRVPPQLRTARSCYKHLAGRLGVAVCDALSGRRCIEVEEGLAVVTAGGLRFLEDFGVDVTRLRSHPATRTCIDWSERRPHLGGAVGVAIHRRCLELRWIRPHLDSRAISLTPAGVRGFHAVFGFDPARFAAAVERLPASLSRA
ncbi:MAG: helix-turn-helix transcriptional regulator [Nevskia sp.]|nr:helix-turn-helix transcriptional regulator [Nevskia sp.]